LAPKVILKEVKDEPSCEPETVPVGDIKFLDVVRPPMEILPFSSMVIEVTLSSPGPPSNEEEIMLSRSASSFDTKISPLPP